MAKELTAREHGDQLMKQIGDVEVRYDLGDIEKIDTYIHSPANMGLSKLSQQEIKFVVFDILDHGHIHGVALGKDSRDAHNIEQGFKRLPRSGKLIRLNTHNDNFSDDHVALPFGYRTLWDHVHSLDDQGEFFAAQSGYELPTKDFAACTKFHDLAEQIIGDAPEYSTKETAGKLHKTPEEKAAQEFIANCMMERSMPTAEIRNYYASIIDLLAGENPLRRFFDMIDKMDYHFPVMRYLLMLRGLPHGERELYFKSFMNAFIAGFDNRFDPCGTYTDDARASLDTHVIDPIVTFWRRLGDPKVARQLFNEDMSAFAYLSPKQQHEAYRLLFERPMHVLGQD